MSTIITNPNVLERLAHFSQMIHHSSWMTILSMLSTTIGRPCALYQSDWQLCAWSPIESSPASALNATQIALLQEYHTQRENTSLSIIIPLADDQQIFGALLVEPPLSASEKPVLEIATNLLLLRLKLDAREAGRKNESVHDFFLQLFGGNTSSLVLNRTALQLDCDISRTVVACIELHGVPTQYIEKITQKMKQVLFISYPSSLIDALLREQGFLLTCLIAVGQKEDELSDWMSDLYFLLQKENECSIFIGISEVCEELEKYPAAFEQALAALWHTRIYERDGGITFHQLMGVYRFPFMRSALEKNPYGGTGQENDYPYREELELLAENDRQYKRSELIQTLKCYLDCGGQINLAAKKLGLTDQGVSDRLKKMVSVLQAHNKSTDVRDPSILVELGLALSIFLSRSV